MSEAAFDPTKTPVASGGSPVVLVSTPPKDRLLARLWRHRSGRVGLILLALYVLLLVAGPFIVAGSPSSDVDYQNISNNLQPSSSAHWLGTDEMGRDVAVRLIEGGRYTVLIGVMAVVCGVVIGVPLGAISGFYRGWADVLIQRFIDIVLAFPHLLLALAIVSSLGPNLRNLIIAVALASFPRFVRLVRASVLSVREQPYVEAALALGVSRWKVLWRHVLPNSFTPVIVQAPLEVGSAILSAAGLGFLGLGVQAPTPEWGTMLGDARDLIFTNSSLATYPGLLIVGAILAVNLVGDGLRDVLDPRLRNSAARTSRARRAARKAHAAAQAPTGSKGAAR
jgi:peptide/nickel transport system permease protein